MNLRAAARAGLLLALSIAPVSAQTDPTDCERNIRSAYDGSVSPDIHGCRLVDVSSTLFRLYRLGKPSLEDASAPRGTITRTDPRAGQPLADGGALTLYVSTGNPPAQPAVPEPYVPPQPPNSPWQRLVQSAGRHPFYVVLAGLVLIGGAAGVSRLLRRAPPRPSKLPPAPPSVSCAFEPSAARLTAKAPLVSGPTLKIAMEFDRGGARTNAIAILGRRSAP